MSQHTAYPMTHDHGTSPVYFPIHEWLIFYAKLVGKYTIVPWILWVFTGGSKNGFSSAVFLLRSSGFFLG